MTIGQDEFHLRQFIVLKGPENGFGVMLNYSLDFNDDKHNLSSKC